MFVKYTIGLLLQIRKRLARRVAACLRPPIMLSKRLLRERAQGAGDELARLLRGIDVEIEDVCGDLPQGDQTISELADHDSIFELHTRKLSEFNETLREISVSFRVAADADEKRAGRLEALTWCLLILTVVLVVIALVPVL